MLPAASWILASLFGLLSFVAVYFAVKRFQNRNLVKRFRSDEKAQMEFGVTAIIAVVITIIVAIVSLLVIGDLADDYISAGADIVNVFNTETTNNTTADAIAPTLGIIIAFIILFALISLVAFSAKLRGNGG